MQELLITEDALERIKLIQSQEGEGFLRITVDGGGCSGFSKNGLPALVTDTISLNYLSGSKITWKEDLSGASFSIDNPNATSSCGCGTSFSVT